MLSTVVSYITDADNSTGILLVLLFAFIYVYGEIADAYRKRDTD